MSPQPARATQRALSPMLLAAVALAAIAGLSAVWAALAYRSGGNAGWMCLVAALDAALLLRLAGQPGGPRRVLLASAITVATAVAAAILIAATEIGLGMGLLPGEAVLRMSAELAWLYASANGGWHDLFWLLAGLALAWLGGR